MSTCPPRLGEYGLGFRGLGVQRLGFRLRAPLTALVRFRMGLGAVGCKGPERAQVSIIRFRNIYIYIGVYIYLFIYLYGFMITVRRAQFHKVIRSVRWGLLLSP